jgi:hypothetical protein
MMPEDIIPLQRDRPAASGDAGDPVTAFAAGRIGRHEAMRRLGLDYGRLIGQVAARGLELPRLPDAETDAMADDFVRIWNQMPDSRTKRVTLLIPDAGPLISLASADSLGLLTRLDLPILLVDEVVAEVTRNPNFPEVGRLNAFLRDHPALVRVVETFVGRAAAERRRQEPGVRLRGLGEAAIAELVARIDEFVDPDEPILVLFEDSDVRRIQVLIRGNVHLLSTRSLLLGMERAGLIPSAEAVWQAIHAIGRRPAAMEVDQPAPAAYGGSRWLP